MKNMTRHRYRPQPKPVLEGECVHHWIIESPRGPSSPGVCKYCGATQEFRNYIPFSSWEDESPNKAAAQTGGKGETNQAEEPAKPEAPQYVAGR